jgi:hypothetical protein
MIKHLKPDMSFLSEIRERKGNFDVSGDILDYHANKMKGLMILNSSNKVLPCEIVCSSHEFQIIIVLGIVFCSIYKAPKSKVDSFTGSLISALKAFHNFPIFVGGDFNISPKKEAQFNNLRSALEEIGILWRPITTHNYSFIGVQGKSLIDHMFFNSLAESIPSLCYYADDTYGSDHRPIILELNLDLKLTPVIKYRLNSKNLTKKKALDRFVKLIDIHVNSFNKILDFTEHRLVLDKKENYTDIISTAEDYICDSIFNIASSCFGLIEYGHPQGYAFNKKLLNLQRQYRNAIKLFKKNICNKTKVSEIRKRKNKLIKEMKNSQTEKLYEIINQGPGPSQTHQLKNFLKPQSGGSTHTQEQVDKLADAFQERFNGIGKPCKTKTSLELFNSEKLDELFDEDNIFKLIRKLNGKKAIGFGGLKISILKPIAKLIAPILKRLFTIIFNSGTIPRSWSKFRTILLKKDKNVDSINNYRPIALGSHIRKVYEILILSRLNAVTKNKIHDHQNGFRRRRGCIDHCLSLDTTLRLKTSVDVVFLDIKAAYDSVNRSKLWNKMSKMEIPSDLIRCCISLFDNNSTVIDLDNKISKPVYYHSGLQQGSALSPLLYSIFINELTQILEALPVGYKTSVCQYEFCCLFFADDIALITSGPDRASLMMLEV